MAERGLAGAIVSELGIQCDTGDRSQELVRGIRLHAEKLLAGLSDGDMDRAQLGLGHSYSRSKVKFNVNRSDNMIIQAIALLDTLDKDVNTFAMRVREWYGWHFPELVRLVSDNMIYAKLASFIRSKERLSEEHLEELAEILDGDETAARNVLDASRASMGTEISEVDMDNIDAFAERVVELAAYRKRMHAYLVEKMHLVAPNVSSDKCPEAGSQELTKACTPTTALCIDRRGHRGTVDLARWFTDEPGQVSSIDGSNPWCRKGFVQSSQDQGQYAKVRLDLPRFSHRTCGAQK